MKFSRLLRRLVTLNLFIALSFFLLTGCQKSEQEFRFIFMTDIHLQPEGVAPEGFRAAIRHANALQPDFVITGGDLVRDALAAPYSRADSLYNYFISFVRDFNMPVYHTIGNHEVFGLYVRSGVSPDHPEYGKEMFRRRLGQGTTYRSFDHKGWHFMLLDGIGFTPDRRYFGYVDSTEMAWIKKDLAGVDPSTPIAITIHIPFYTIFSQIGESPTTANSPGEVITNANDVRKLFDGYNLRMVLAGHLHWTEEIIFRDVHYINVGAVSGAWWKGPYRECPEGFAVIDVRGDNFTWRYEDYGWHVTPEAE